MRLFPPFPIQRWSAERSDSHRWKRFDTKPYVRGWQPVDAGREADGTLYAHLSRRRWPFTDSPPTSLFLAKTDDYNGGVQVCVPYLNEVDDAGLTVSWITRLGRFARMKIACVSVMATRRSRACRTMSPRMHKWGIVRTSALEICMKAI